MRMRNQIKFTRALTGIILALGFSILILFASEASGQTIFPLTLTLEWDPNPTDNEVTSYSLTFNNEQTVEILADATNCTTTTCKTTITVQGNGQQTVRLTATNRWGTSEATVLTFNVVGPGRVQNIRVRS